MRNLKYTFLVFLVGSLILFQQCTSKITRRYKRISCYDSTANADEYIKVTAFSLDGVSSSNSIFDLTESAQKALVEQTSSKAQNNQDFYAQLSQPFIDTREKAFTITSYAKFTKILVISVEKLNLKEENGANRIDNFKVFLSIKEKNKDKIRFTSWDKLITDYQAVDIGKLISNQVGSISVTPEISISGIAQGKTSLSSLASSNIGEEVSLIKKFASVSGSLTNDKISITRYSAPLENISGNIVMELTIESNHKNIAGIYEFKNLFQGDTAATPENVQFAKNYYEFPKIDVEESEVYISYEFQFREVKRGASSFSEADDVIILRSGKKNNCYSIPLLENDDLKKGKSWIICLKNDRTKHLRLKLSKDKRLGDLMRFSSSLRALTFLQWLEKTTSTGLDIYKFYLGNNILRKDDISNLKVISTPDSLKYDKYK